MVKLQRTARVIRALIQACWTLGPLTGEGSCLAPGVVFRGKSTPEPMGCLYLWVWFGGGEVCDSRSAPLLDETGGGEVCDSRSAPLLLDETGGGGQWVQDGPTLGWDVGAEVKKQGKRLWRKKILKWRDLLATFKKYF